MQVSNVFSSQKKKKEKTLYQGQVSIVWLIRNIEELEKCTKGLEKGMLVYNLERAVCSELLKVVHITINQQFDQKQRLVKWQS